MMPEKVDLREQPAFSLALLDDAWVWRHRVVETLEVGLADHVSVTTRYQLEFPPDLVANYVGAEASEARLFLPITTRHKKVLLGFSARGPRGGPAHLLLRATIADLEAHYVTGFVQAIDDQGLQDALSYDLIRAIAAAAPATYEHFLAEAKGDRVAGLTAYVHGGIGVALTQGELRGLLQIMEPASEALASALGEPIDDRSAAENVLLAMPYLPPSGRPTSVEEVHELAEQYTDAIVGGQVEQWLLALVAEYGRRWEVILEIDAPLREPFTVQLCQERPVVIRGRSLLRHEVALDDARSYHLQVRVIDPSVRIAPGPVLRDSEGAIVGIPNLEGGRDTAELFAVYSSEPDRPTQAMAELTLQPVESVRFTATVVEVLAWFAVAAALLVSGEEALLLAKLGILTIPTTFAVALLLVREQSPVAARLMRWRKRRTLGAFLILWVVTLARLVW